ncbi:MAG TPA: hypothetical protein VH208_11960 [Myxococcaceae bacterium]|jgi:hypothetical protein|nr:hypothetical protein [Myxococcaceae bacterium]
MRVEAPLALALLFGGTALGEEPKQGKLRVSGNGVFAIRMVETAKDACRVEATKDSEPLWQLDKCLGDSEDYYFVSNDGTRFWVLRTTPEKPGAPKAKKKGLPWYQVEVATLYDAQGNSIQSKRLMDLVPKLDQGKVRQLGKHFVWLEGVDEVPGRKPRINDVGQVEFEVAGSKTQKLNF